MFDHPNVVQIFELGEDERGQFYIAMELVNGINLRQLITLSQEKARRFPPELAAYIMAQVLEGLAYAHEFRNREGKALKLVHRDVSPQNILLSYDGAVKLVDFGIAKGTAHHSETQAGMLKGKIAYMSPEQAFGDAIDARSDLFSAGVCFYELITQERPFQGRKRSADLEGHPRVSAQTHYPLGCGLRIQYRSLRLPRARKTAGSAFSKRAFLRGGTRGDSQKVPCFHRASDLGELRGQPDRRRRTPHRPSSICHAPGT